MKEIPVFKNIREEAVFWETHDSSKYMDWNNATHVCFPKLEPSDNFDIIVGERSVETE